MWLVAFFDLPTTTKKHKRNYVRFRNYLLDEGFWMLQWSVYARPCPTPEATDALEERVESQLPPEGEVRLLSLTSMQFARMRVFWGGTEGPPENPPDQLTMF